MYKDDEMTLSTPRFDWSFNFGHVLTCISMMVAMGGGLWAMSSSIAGIENRLLQSEARAQVWIPRMEGMMKSDTIQDNRIENLADAVKGIRADIAESARANRLDMADINKSVSSLRELGASSAAKLDNALRQKN